MSDDAAPDAPVEAAKEGRRRRHRKKGRRHRDRERHERRPRVNPVFLWVKQDGCRIVSVHCEDYDSRNRITITKTSHGWRAIPKTERFASVLVPRNNVMAPAADGHTVVATPCRLDDCDDKENDALLRGSEERAGSDCVAEGVLTESGEGAEVEEEVEEEDHGTANATSEDLHNDLHKVLQENLHGGEEHLHDDALEDIEAILQEGDNNEDENEDTGKSEDIQREQNDEEDAPKDTLEHPSGRNPKESEDSLHEDCGVNPEDLIEECPVDTDENVDSDIPVEVRKEMQDEPPEEPPHEEPVSVHEDDAMDGLPEDLPEDIRRELVEARSDERSDNAGCHEGEDDDLPEELLAELRETFARCDAEEEGREEEEREEEEEEALTHSLVHTSLVSAASSPPLTKEGNMCLSPEELKARLPAALEVTVVRKQASPPPPQSRLQQHKFLESLLASPKKSDLDAEEAEQREPLDLGPPPTKRTASPVTPPASKKPKLDDITLRHLLSRHSENAGDAKPEEDTKRAAKIRRSSEPPPGFAASAAAAAAHKSRLLELLTKEGNVDADPLAQLKQVLSDPDLMVPDPLLVPRSRLQALVTSPAQEIPRLLAQNAETRVPYAGDTLVVPLSHLTSLLQPAAGAPPSSYQTADVLQQMMWLPYLEAAYNSAMMPGVAAAAAAADYKAQVELQNALAVWQDAVLKGTYEQLLHSNNNNISSSNKNLKAAKPSAPHKYPPSLLPARTQPPPAVSPTFAAPQRPHHYQQQQKRQQRHQLQQQQLEYQQQLLLLQQLQQYQHQQLLQQFQPKRDFLPSPPGSRTPHPYARPSTPSTPPCLRTSPAPPVSGVVGLPGSQEPHVARSPTHSRSRTRTPTERSSESPSEKGGVERVEKALDSSAADKIADKTVDKPVDKVAVKPTERPKLKVKNLVDPNATPRLLQIQQPPTPGLPTGLPLRPGSEDDSSAPHLWHPLFGRRVLDLSLRRPNYHQKAYTGPWQWTTVTVNGE